MNLLEASFLGILQGITEFLPVSSSGHLAILQNFYGFKPEYISYNIFLHIATLAAVLIYFRKDIIALVKSAASINKYREDENARMLMLILAATFVTGAAGLAFKDFVYGVFEKPVHVGLLLLITAGVIFAADSRKKPGISMLNAPLWHGVVIGLFQSLALLPGISRSGFTIACAVFLGWSRRDAFRFSFLAAVPAIFGAGILDLKDNPQSISDAASLTFIIGGLLAFLAGYAALMLLKKFVTEKKFYIFSIYLLLFAVFIFVKF